MKNKLSLVAEQIISAAVELFKRNGYENTSINAICKYAGVNRSSFYNAFSGKEDIIIHMFSTSQQSVEEIMGNFVSAKNDFERMWMLCDSHLSTLLKLGPELTSALFRIPLCRHTDFVAIQSSINEWCIKLYKNCLAQGIAHSSVKPEELVPLVTQSVNYIAYDWSCVNGSYDLRKKARRAVEVLYGVAPEYCRSYSG